MAQVFSQPFNTLFRVLLIGLPLGGTGTGVLLAAFYRSDYTTGVRDVVEQPVMFSHKHHNAELGIDCRYCHASAESSAVAGIPPTKTCMNCHQAMWSGTSSDAAFGRAASLQPVRDSYNNNTPLVWNKVHNVPHYTYFNHSIHLSKGVGCVSCHGDIDNMNGVYQTKTLLMEWCLDCHRNPEKHLRPRSEIYNMTWKPKDGSVDLDGEKFSTTLSQGELGRKLKDKYQIRDHNTITNCSICHR